jgi:hypothetical protein
MAMNTYVSSYLGPSRARLSLEESRSAVRRQLEPMIKDDVFYQVTQSGLRRSQGLPTE